MESINKVSSDLSPMDIGIGLKKQHWTVWFQFENGEPIQAFQSVPLGQKINIVFPGPGENSSIIFKDPTTNRVFRLFGRLTDE